ncbi:hypothetical protein MCHI_002288, partial [Candidatus Magnetoovum chiemensis]
MKLIIIDYTSRINQILLLAVKYVRELINISLRVKIFSVFTFLFLITLIVLPITYLYGIPFTNIKGVYIKDQLSVLYNLSIIADIKKDAVIQLINTQRYDGKAIAASEVITHNVESLSSKQSYNDVEKYLKTFNDTHIFLEEMFILDMASSKIALSTT